MRERQRGEVVGYFIIEKKNRAYDWVFVNEGKKDVIFRGEFTNLLLSITITNDF